jgi:hypothetical protein
VATDRIRITEAGWCRLERDPSLVVMVRFAGTDTGRITIAELVVARFPGVNGEAVRTLPVRRLEAWANGQGREDVLAAIRDREALTKRQQDKIDDRERAEAVVRAGWGTGPEAQAQEERMEAEADRLGVREQVAAGYVAMGSELDGSPVALRSRVRNLRLRVPAGQPKPDRFYAEVARLYAEVAVDSSRPAAVLAEANDVPLSRVHGWIKEARARGLLAAGARQASESGDKLPPKKARKR